jgi:ubiquinone/menaquinone biosynthesis C-methylase UbiE
LIVASGGPPAALAAKSATSTIPIVFTGVGEPVALGLVASLARPGGNVTGVSFLTVELSAKRIELISELVPQAEAIALLVNPNYSTTESIIRDAREAARAGGVRLQILIKFKAVAGMTAPANGVSMNSAASRFFATDANAYEPFMGRWSRRLAGPFLEFANIQPGDRALDVGCGTGVLTVALAERGHKAVGIDASEAYLDGARRLRPHADVTYEVGDVRHLPYGDASFGACVSTLVLDIIPEVDQVAREMRRVTRPGGVVASGIFDFWAGFSAGALVSDTGSVLDEGFRALRDDVKSHPLARANSQAELWRRTALTDVVEVPIVLSFDYASFEDYWSSYSTGPTRIARRLTTLPSETRAEIERHVRAGYLAGLPDGPRSFAIIVRAVRGTVPR